MICINAGGGIYLKEAFEQFRVSGQQLLKLRPRWLSQLPLIDLLFTRASVARPIARCWGRQRVIDFVTELLRQQLWERCWTPLQRRKLTAYPRWCPS